MKSSTHLDLLRMELRRDEGYSTRSYQDTAGLETCGIGHNCIVRPLPASWTYPLSSQQIEALFKADLARAIVDLDICAPWWMALDPVRQRVVVNMTFNLGIRGFLKFKKMCAALQVEDWNEAARQMMDSRWAGQVGVRAVRLRDMMLGGKDLS